MLFGASYAQRLLVTNRASPGAAQLLPRRGKNQQKERQKEDKRKKKIKENKTLSLFRQMALNAPNNNKIYRLHKSSNCPWAVHIGPTIMPPKTVFPKVSIPRFHKIKWRNQPLLPAVFSRHHTHQAPLLIGKYLFSPSGTVNPSFLPIQDPKQWTKIQEMQGPKQLAPNAALRKGKLMYSITHCHVGCSPHAFFSAGGTLGKSPWFLNYHSCSLHTPPNR